MTAGPGSSARLMAHGPCAVVGAAFVCLAAATEATARTGADLGITLDQVMSAMSRL
jgi:hypothetical protein